MEAGDHPEIKSAPLGETLDQVGDADSNEMAKSEDAIRDSSPKTAVKDEDAIRDSSSKIAVKSEDAIRDSSPKTAVNSEDAIRDSSPKTAVKDEGDHNTVTVEETRKNNEQQDGSNIAESPPSAIDDLIKADKENDFVIFHCVWYLGAASTKQCRNEGEIQRLMSFLNSQPVDNGIEVAVSIPLHYSGNVILYEEETLDEISRFRINQIIFFARGVAGTPDAGCFAFTCSHGESLENSLFQCHAFRCDVPEAVDRVFLSFAKAFAAPKDGHSPTSNAANQATTSKQQETSMFEVSLEVKEDDGKGNYSVVPRDKGCFKLRSSTPKHIVLTVQQVPDPSKEFIVERCFGLLLSPGRMVRHSDMQLVETLSWSIGSNGQDRKTYVVTGLWDSNDPAFEVLNQETPKESSVFFTVAVDIVIKGIQEPIRFVLETKAKIYPAAERFWIIGRRNHFTQQFALTLKRDEEGATAGGTKFKVLDITPLGEVDKNKTSFNLNFTSFIRSSSLGSLEIDTPSKDDDDDSDDDEPLQSGMGEVSKECSDEQIRSWSDVLGAWGNDAVTRPKNLAILVHAGIPDALRGEIWQRLSGCHNDEDMMNKYRTLLSQECTLDDVIMRDINRTFPANDYFKESGGTGQELLYKISKSYALFDHDVNYCQGISFIGAALLLKMPEEQAFCLLVKIMYSYGFRDLYKDDFDNLHLKLYQFDRIVERYIPELWAHFRELGIESHMFASQWFLTLFTAKFPLIFVFRVIDIFLLEGTRTLFQVGVALLAAARKDLLVLDFEGILKYFRVSLPKKYRHIENTNTLIRAAAGLKIKKLKKYEAEYLAIKEQERNYVDPVTRLTQENKKLMEDKLRLEQMVTNLVLTNSSLEDTVESTKEELKRTASSLKEAEDFNQRLKEQSDSVKELFQREVKQYDDEGEKKKSIIAEYKRICSKLSSQLEEEQKIMRERMIFFQNNLCEQCSAFVSTAAVLVSRSSNGDLRKTSPSPLGDRSSPLGSTSDAAEIILQPLENELAKCKIALAEAECKNDDLNHQLAVATAELEAYRNNSGGTGAWLWKNLSFNKEHKKHPSNSSADDTNTSTPSPQAVTSGPGSIAMTSSHSLQNIAKKLNP